MSCDTAGAPREAEATGATASTSAIALTNRSVFFIYLPLQCGCQADPFPDGLVPSGRKAPRSPFHRGPAILFHRRRAVNTRRKSPWRSLVSDTIRPTTDRSSQAQAGSPTGAPPWSPPSGSCPPPRPAGKAGPVWVVSGMCPEHLSGMCPERSVRHVSGHHTWSASESLCRCYARRSPSELTLAWASVRECPYMILGEDDPDLSIPKLSVEDSSRLVRYMRVESQEARSGVLCRCLDRSHQRRADALPAGGRCDG